MPKTIVLRNGLEVLDNAFGKELANKGMDPENYKVRRVGNKYGFRFNIKKKSKRSKYKQ